MGDRLNNIRVIDPVLTTIALGYSNADAVGDFLAPYVPVALESGKIPSFGKEAFKLYNTTRAIRAASNRMNPEGIQMIPYAIEEHDLEYPIDYREDTESMFNMQKLGTRTLQGIFAVEREKQIADIAQAAATYGDGNKVKLTGNDKWSDYTPGHSNPNVDVDAGREAVRARTGKYPNVGVIGPTAFSKAKRHPEVLARFQFTGKITVTAAMLAELWEIDHLYVGKMVYADDADVFHDIWADNVVLGYVPQTSSTDRDVYEPSFAYTIRKKSLPQVDVRTENGGKLILVRNTDCFAAKVLGADAGYLIEDTNA
ncbi:MAG: hypothetical protein GX556_16515 [Fibrobacter sp.]|nr:hypothetical protein [Fibrobacter sp.]